MTEREGDAKRPTSPTAMPPERDESADGDPVERADGLRLSMGEADAWKSQRSTSSVRASPRRRSERSYGGCTLEIGYFLGRRH
ncbi:hypothetical protein ACFU7Z_01320 [Kitasatospora sp. NPDC057518]|uniref:hypothetical protein n=1 Tax=Kitasatospora sp. NPDC057518 TaxID=3346155 RepID=UPI003685C82C